MKKVLIIISIFFYVSGEMLAQTYTYDNNHQITQITYANGSVATIQYDANGNRTSYTVTGGALPVTLLFFNAQKSGEQVLLTWATSQEINTDRFEVEHSKDGIAFSSFTIVPAAGNSSVRKEYSTLHCCPAEGVNYYRLKMIDQDGSFKYSEIRRVTFELTNVMRVFPNPVAGKAVLNISFAKPFIKDANITIHNAVGALIYRSTLTKGITTAQLNTGGFAAGSYYITVSVEEKYYKKEFVKQ